jgi:hypothetical protein
MTKIKYTMSRKVKLSDYFLFLYVWHKWISLFARKWISSRKITKHQCLWKCLYKNYRRRRSQMQAYTHPYKRMYAYATLWVPQRGETMPVDLEINKITICTTLSMAMPPPSERIFRFYEIPKHQTWCLIPGGLGMLIEMFILL